MPGGQPLTTIPQITTPGTPVPGVEQAPITLLDESAPEASMLRTVLRASVTKARAYPITLEAALKLIEDQNLPIARDRLTAKLQNTAFLRSLSDMLPDVYATYDQSRFQGVIQIFGDQTIPIYRTQYVPQLLGRWTLYPGGRQIFEALAAKRRHQAARTQVLDTLQNQLAQTAAEYYLLIEAKVRVENAKASIAEATSQVRQSEARLKAGVGTKLDLAQAESQLAVRERELIDAENATARAEQTLLNRLNLDPNIGLEPLDALAQPRVLVPMHLTTDELVAWASQHNPALKVVDSDLKALSAESKGIISRVVPSVTLQTYINGTGPAWDKLGLSRFGGLTLEANLLENLGTAIPLDYRAKRLEYRRLQVERQALLRDIQSQVVFAFLDSRAFAKAILTAQEQLLAAQEAYRLSKGRYRAGLGINLDVLSAEAALNNARDTLARAILGFNRAQVDLLRAIGESTVSNLMTGLKTGVGSASATTSPVTPASSASQATP